MSVSDPLIKDIKGHLLQLFNESTASKITDLSQNLLSFCQVLEKIFYRGLNQNQNVFYGSKKIEVFAWMSSIPAEGSDVTDFKYKSSVEEVQTCKNVTTSVGKFRLLIRHCLMKNCLHFPLQSLIDSNKQENLYEKNSIIGDEILSAILLSVFLQCNKINFDLQLCNSYFLDSTWEIPDLVKVEFVPCQNLGVSISFSDNKAVIVHVESNSVASECPKISKGDVLANLNGVEITYSCKGRLNTILRLSKRRPVKLIIIKAFYKQSNAIFPPIKNILGNLHIDLTKVTNVSTSTLEASSTSQSSVSIAQNTKTGYKGTYVGCTNVGNKGSVKQIAEGIKRCLINTDNVKKPIIFEIGEISIKIVDFETHEIVLKHSYMQISSCGSAPHLPTYIAYIAGEENCDLANNNFICYVFHVKDVEEAAIILQSIGQGFYRTHFAV